MSFIVWIWSGDNFWVCLSSSPCLLSIWRCRFQYLQGVYLESVVVVYRGVLELLADYERRGEVGLDVLQCCKSFRFRAVVPDRHLEERVGETAVGGSARVQGLEAADGGLGSPAGALLVVEEDAYAVAGEVLAGVALGLVGQGDTAPSCTSRCLPGASA